ncbi:MAG: TIGR02680 family protein, partial [Acetatifactor sp.]|nr:TIGR02680 family protein [Acetatifactor sp.]
MGLLDALIVPAEYRETIEALDEGVCDRYIFSDTVHVKQNLLEWLDVDNGENDILRYQSISNILSSIGVCKRGNVPSGGKTDPAYGSTWVDERGNYRIGVMEGTVTGEYQARYIGVRARERFRGEKIAQLEQEELSLRGQLEECEGRIRGLEAERELLQREWDGFPRDTDIKEAAREYSARNYELEQLNRQISDHRELLRRVREELDEIQLRVREICSKCYLTARLDLFSGALEALGKYKELFIKIRVGHGQYQNGILYLNTLEDALETVDRDLDTIRYELGRISRKKSDLEASLHSVREQLKLTDYEKIKERLDYCLERLNVLPVLREESAMQQTNCRDTVEQLG